jgi:hypothetical protein
LLVERNTPLPLVPANSPALLRANEEAEKFERSPLTRFQLAPLSVERQTPAFVPARRVESMTAKQEGVRYSIPLVRVHWA